MKKFFILLVLVVTVVGTVASQNAVTEKDIVGRWRDNLGFIYVFDNYSSGKVTHIIGGTAGAEGVYLIEGDEILVAWKNGMWSGKKPMSNDRKTLTLKDKSGTSIILTKLDDWQQGKKEETTPSGSYYASRTSFEFKGNNFSGIIDSKVVVWGTFTVSGNSLNLHITGDLDGEKSASITFTIIDVNTIADPSGTLYKRK